MLWGAKEFAHYAFRWWHLLPRAKTPVVLVACWWSHFLWIVEVTKVLLSKFSNHEAHPMKSCPSVPEDYGFACLSTENMITKTGPSSAGCAAAPISRSNNLKRPLYACARNPLLTFHFLFGASPAQMLICHLSDGVRLHYLVCWFGSCGPLWQLWLSGVLLVAK